MPLHKADVFICFGFFTLILFSNMKKDFDEKNTFALWNIDDNLGRPGENGDLEKIRNKHC